MIRDMHACCRVLTGHAMRVLGEGGVRGAFLSIVSRDAVNFIE